MGTMEVPEYDPSTNLVRLADWTPEAIGKVIDLGIEIKADPGRFADVLVFDGVRQAAVSHFDKASTRTAESFRIAVGQLGGIPGKIESGDFSTVGRKEDWYDVITNYVELGNRVIAARINLQLEMEEAAGITTQFGVPMLNLMTSHNEDLPRLNLYSDHPHQALTDAMTAKEYLDDLRGITFAYVGDARNNVTHSLMIVGAAVGANVTVGCPAGHSPLEGAILDANRFADITGSKIRIVHDAREAVADADVVYTDAWMSYHINPEEREERIRTFLPFQVNQALLDSAGPSRLDRALYMHCLPQTKDGRQYRDKNGNLEILRGEVTKDVAETIFEKGGHSVVYHQAGNRTQIQKAVIAYLIDKNHTS